MTDKFEDSVHALKALQNIAERADSDEDEFASVELPWGFTENDREFVATFNPELVLGLIACAQQLAELKAAFNTIHESGQCGSDIMSRDKILAWAKEIEEENV